MSSEMQDKQTALDCRYIRMAQIWAENSYCKRRQVGSFTGQKQNDYFGRI